MPAIDVIPREDRDFFVYGVQPPTEKELEKINAVREQYGIDHRRDARSGDQMSPVAQR